MPGYNFTAQSASPKHESLAHMGEAFMLSFSAFFIYTVSATVDDILPPLNVSVGVYEKKVHIFKAFAEPFSKGSIPLFPRTRVLLASAPFPSFRYRAERRYSRKMLRIERADFEERVGQPIGGDKAVHICPGELHFGTYMLGSEVC